MNKPAQHTRHLIKIAPDRLRPAFWTVACAISLTVNVVLIAALLLVGAQVFKIKQLLTNQVLGGLYTNFQLMDQARIQTNVKVDSTIPVQFDLPVKTDTTVTLTQDTAISGARVNLSTGGLTITSAPADIILPAGTRLPIALDISVPVNASVPVQLNVPVDIPLNQTDLHAPFVGLQQVVAPYYRLLQATPSSWAEFWCGVPSEAWCKALFK